MEIELSVKLSKLPISSTHCEKFTIIVQDYSWDFDFAVIWTLLFRSKENMINPGCGIYSEHKLFWFKNLRK